ncbi:MAG: hypothetical protein KAQ92_00305 [Candidatus Aenigmarchaeota archaeon]|nr:hypothetical protein [Candidatus Aenigmarchaeota archaeon]
MYWIKKLNKNDQKYLKQLLKDVLHYKDIAKKEDESIMQMWVCMIKLYERQILLEKKIADLTNNNKSKSNQKNNKPKILNDLMKY